MSEFQQAVRTLIEWIGEDPDREGLKDTPERVARSFAEFFDGYGREPNYILKCFSAEDCDELIVVKDIEFVSFCEHHILPFQGVAHVGYIPNGRIVGLSKIPRLVDIFAKRLQVQERLTTQVANALMEHLQPKGVGCVIEAKHSCLSCRGAKKQNAKMITSCLLGVMREDSKARSEFLDLIRSKT